MNKYGSEVAQLRQQIAEELEAMQQGFHGLATGAARHEFIHARMERLGIQQEQLADYLGECDAAKVVCELYIQTISGRSI